MNQPRSYSAGLLPALLLKAALAGAQPAAPAPTTTLAAALGATGAAAETAFRNVAHAPLATSAEVWAAHLRYPNVRAAQAAAWPAVLARLRRHHLNSKQLELFIRVFKTQETLEVWGRNRGKGGPFALIHAYPLAALSGTLGPKRRAGDFQTPEGFYTIDRYNPDSNYLLSLGLDYPNAADRALGEPHPGKDIFIHGSDVTIGCLPITDAGIREVYLLALAARAAGQQAIAVHIFPFPLTKTALAQHAASPHLAFWRGLASGWAYFEKKHELR